MSRLRVTLFGGFEVRSALGQPVAVPRARMSEPHATNSSIGARWEAERTLLALVDVERAAGDTDAAPAHAREAVARFDELRLPQWVERAQRLLAEIGLKEARRP